MAGRNLLPDLVPSAAGPAALAGARKPRNLLAEETAPISFDERFGRTPYLDYDPTTIRVGAQPPVTFENEKGPTGEEISAIYPQAAAAAHASGREWGKQGPPTEEFPNTPEAKGLPPEWALGAFLTMNPEAQQDIVRRAMPGVEFKQDAYGNPMIRKPGDAEWTYFNKSGLSLMDLPNLGGEVLKYIPAAKLASLPKGIIGRVLTAMVGAGATDVAGQEAAKLLGSEQQTSLNEGVVAGLAGGAGQLVGEAISKGSRLIGNALRGEARITSQDLKDLAEPLFKRAENLGIRVGPDGLDQEIANLRLLASSEGALPHATMDQTTGLIKNVGKTTPRFPQTNAVLDDIGANPGTQSTLRDLWQIRQALSDAQWAAQGSDQKVARQLLDHYDDFLDNMLPSDVIAGRPEEGVALLREASDLWHRAQKTTVIERAIANAMVSPNRSTAAALRNEFRKLVRAPDFRRRWTRQEQQTLREAAKSSSGEAMVNFLGLFAPRGIVSTAGTYYLVGPAGWAAGELGMAASTAMAGARAGRLQDMVATGVAKPLDLGRSSPLVPALAAGEAERRQNTPRTTGRFAHGGVARMAGGGKVVVVGDSIGSMDGIGRYIRGARNYARQGLGSHAIVGQVPTDADVVVVSMGANDSPNNFQQTLAAAQAARARNPRARFIWLLPHNNQAAATILEDYARKIPGDVAIPLTAEDVAGDPAGVHPFGKYEQVAARVNAAIGSQSHPSAAAQARRDPRVAQSANYTGREVVNPNSLAAMQFFMSPEGGGWDAPHAAALVGSLQQESYARLDPAAHGDYSVPGHSWGVAQWNQGRLARLRRLPNWQDRRTQYGFVNWELNNSHKAAGDAFRATNDPQRMAHILASQYEGAGIPATGARARNARALLMAYNADPSLSNAAAAAEALATGRSIPAAPVTPEEAAASARRIADVRSLPGQRATAADFFGYPTRRPMAETLPLLDQGMWADTIDQEQPTVAPFAYAEPTAGLGASAPQERSLPDWADDLDFSSPRLARSGPGGYDHLLGTRGGQPYSAYQTKAGRVWMMPAGPPPQDEYAGAPVGYYSFVPGGEPRAGFGRRGLLARLFGGF